MRQNDKRMHVDGGQRTIRPCTQNTSTMRKRH